MNTTKNANVRSTLVDGFDWASPVLLIHNGDLPGGDDFEAQCNAINAHLDAVLHPGGWDCSKIAGTFTTDVSSLLDPGSEIEIVDLRKAVR